MNKRTIQSQSANELVAQLLRELESINRDIFSLKSRLCSGLTDERQIRANIRYLDDAQEQKDQVLDLLVLEYTSQISLEKLMYDIQNKN